MSGSILLTFDVEEHYRIEAAVGYDCPPALRDEYASRMETSTRRLLDLLAKDDVKAGFYIVGRIAETHPQLVRDIHEAGHEVGSHSYDHQRVMRFSPEGFREDLLRSKDTLEQCIGAQIVGFRAPTFSVVKSTAWAIDVLAECGFTYDSSIFPVRHDRYGIVDAPRTPFVACGPTRSILEIPPLTWRMFGYNLPVAGGGYFRLFPPSFMLSGVRQAMTMQPAVAMLYFHPWEFDADQPQLPMGRISRFRTYVGTGRSSQRLRRLIAGRRFELPRDVAARLQSVELPRYNVSTAPTTVAL